MRLQILPENVLLLDMKVVADMRQRLLQQELKTVFMDLILAMTLHQELKIHF